jgi:hypothetical protein
MPFNIQQTLHLLPLPYDIVENINSFLFYDSITGKTRYYKKIIHRKFKNAICSRKYPLRECDCDSDSSELWMIDLSDIHFYYDENYLYYDHDFRKSYFELPFQATNCSDCGNYKISSCTHYSVLELNDALLNHDLDLVQSIRDRMAANLRCECMLRIE